MTQDVFQDPNIVLFQGPYILQPGEVELHGLKEAAGRLFGRSLEDIKADWQKVSNQMRTILQAAEPETPEGFRLETVTVSLGFSAQGRLVFIAEAGVEASISVTLKRP